MPTQINNSSKIARYSDIIKCNPHNNGSQTEALPPVASVCMYYVDRRFLEDYFAVSVVELSFAVGTLSLICTTVKCVIFASLSEFDSGGRGFDPLQELQKQPVMSAVLFC